MAHPSAPTQFIWSWTRFFITCGLIALIVGGLFLLIFWMMQTNPQGRARVVGEQAFTVRADILSADDVAQQLRVSGTVQPARQVDLRPLSSGQITLVHPNLRDGARVKAGRFCWKSNRKTQNWPCGRPKMP